MNLRYTTGVVALGVVLASGVAAVGADAGAAPRTVNAADYATPGSPGSYRWAYASSPLRECAIYPAPGGRGVTCSVAFPAGTPEVSTPPFFGRPNAVQIVGGQVRNIITEGGPPGARVLPVGHQIVVGSITCTALAGGGIDCQSGKRGFRFERGVLTKR